MSPIILATALLLNWSGGQNSTPEQFDVSSDGRGALVAAQAPLDLSPYAGKVVELSIEAEGTNISRPPKSWLGLKFMCVFTDPKSGKTHYPGASGLTGSFSRRPLTFNINLKGIEPGTQLGATLFAGLQGSSGTVRFFPNTLKLSAKDSEFPLWNKDGVARYSGLSNQRMRGVMLPAGDCKEEDFRTLKEWGANLARFQIVRGWTKTNDNQDLPEFDRWLDGRLDHLEQVLKWAGQYGISIVVDLHVPPGGKAASKQFNMFTDERYADHFVQTWRRIAARLYGKKGIFAYDLINEPIQNDPSAPFDYWNLQLKAAKAIRAIDPGVTIIVASNGGDTPSTFRYLTPFPLENIIYQVHVYDPIEYTHQGVLSPRKAYGEYDAYPSLQWNLDFLRKMLKPVRDFQLKYKARIYAGEFSAIAWAPGREKYLQDCIRLFEEYGWDWSYHAFREWDGWSVEHEFTPEGKLVKAETMAKAVLTDGFKGKCDRPLEAQNQAENLQLPTPAERNPLQIPSVLQTVTATFATEQEAKQAALKVLPLPAGKKLAFTTRWDDSAPGHRARAEMFARLGLRPTFFLNGNKEFMQKDMPTIRELGGRFGNHTSSHPFLMESSASIQFSEVMGNRIFIECQTDEPVTSFVIPFNWNSPLDPKRAASLGRILLNTGHYVSSDWPKDEVRQPPFCWMPGRTFGANDTNPDAEQFTKNLGSALKDVSRSPDWPKVTFGIHSWCNPDGLLRQEKFLKEVLGKPDWWYTDDRSYGAYRYEFYHSTVRAEVKGKEVVFSIERFDPALLGEAPDLSIRFSPAPTGVVLNTSRQRLQPDASGCFTLPSPYAGRLPKSIALSGEDAASEQPGVTLSLAPDETKRTISVKLSNTTGKPLEDAVLVVNPAPFWSKGRIVEKSPKPIQDACSWNLSLGNPNVAPLPAGEDRLYCAALDYTLGGERFRLYAKATLKGDRLQKSPCPRDMLLVMGPFDKDAFDEKQWTALSGSDAPLPNIGTDISEYWRSMADPNRAEFSAAAYIPWSPQEPQEFKNRVGKLCGEGRDVFLAAVDFFCDEEGTKTLLTNRDKWQETLFFLNGERIAGKGGRFDIKVKKGRNRLIFRWYWFQHWIPQSLLLTICENGDVEKAVPFVKTAVQPRNGVFESNGVSCEFNKHGVPSKLLYKGDPIAEAVTCGMGECLAKNADPDSSSFTREGDSLVCEFNWSKEKNNGKFSAKTIWRITPESIECRAEITPAAGVAWKGPLATAQLFFPSALLAGKQVQILRLGKQPETRTMAKEYDKSNDIAFFSGLVLENGWRLTLENAEIQQMFDRRQWRQQTFNVKIVPRGGISWNGTVSQGEPIRWKMLFEKTAP